MIAESYQTATISPPQIPPNTQKIEQLPQIHLYDLQKDIAPIFLLPIGG